MKRILIASVVGGLILFLWSAVAHMLTPLGEAGMSTLPNEDAVRASLHQSIPNAGLYIFPAPDPAHPDDMKALADKMNSGPVGILVYTPANGAPNMPKLLTIELLTNIGAALIAAILASMIVGSYGRRVVAITLLAVFASVSLSASYWNWYNFPAAFVLGELATELIGMFLAALAIAKIVPSRPVA